MRVNKQNIFFYYVIIFLVLFFFTQCSWARLTIEVTRGITRAIPIAIIPLACKNPNKPHHYAITNIISSDLSHSGHFKVMPKSLIHQYPCNAKGVDYAYWQQKDVDNLIIGSIKPLTDGSYRVHFELLDTYEGGNLINAHILVSQEYTIRANDFRRLAHHLSDVVYQQIIGKRGVFSTRIAYILVEKNKKNGDKVYSLRVADADGHNSAPLLTSSRPIMSPSWSPDGKQIAYVSFEKNHSQIYISELATGKRKLVSSFRGINGAPAWSPDGKQLAVVLSKSGHPKIYMLDINRKQLRQITHGWSIDTEPVWAPTGKSIYFTSDRGGSPQIYHMDLASRNISRITYDGKYNASPSISPDGMSLAFLHGYDHKFTIAYKNLATGTMRVLTNDDDDQSPSIAPNGSMILYASRNKGKGVLAMVATDSRVKLRLPSSGNGNVQEPAWAPFSIEISKENSL